MEKLQVLEQKGDLFDVPQNTLIAHACNCKASWSAGIASEFKKRYPQAYVQYNQACMKEDIKLLGKSKIFKSSMSRKYIDDATDDNRVTYYIGCLFTSYNYGKNKDTASKILENTKNSVEDLLLQVDICNRSTEEKDKIKEIRIPRINAGLFSIPWNKTKDILESVSTSNSSIKTITVIIL